MSILFVPKLAPEVKVSIDSQRHNDPNESVSAGVNPSGNVGLMRIGETIIAC